MYYQHTYNKVHEFNTWMETQATNQQQCNHRWWSEANVGQQTASIRTGSFGTPDVNSTDNNQS